MWSPEGLRSLGAIFAPAFDSAPEVTVARRAMACEFSVTFPGACRGAVEAGCAALDTVERLERALSVYREDSDLSFLNREAARAPVPVGAEIFGLLRASVSLSAATEGAFDAATGALVAAWGFLRGPKRVPCEAGRAAALAASGSRYVVFDERERTVRYTRPGVAFNLGAIGKGFAIDRALDRLRAEYGMRAALMQGGQSSLKGIGAPAGQPRGWPVDIADPARPRHAVARVWLRDRALGTSGTANQFFVWNGKRYGHVLDPRTGWPAEAMLSASAVARTAMEADALSTAFFVMGVEGTRRFCKQHPEIGALLVLPDRSVLRIGRGGYGGTA